MCSTLHLTLLFQRRPGNVGGAVKKHRTLTSISPDEEALVRAAGLPEVSMTMVAAPRTS